MTRLSSLLRTRTRRLAVVGALAVAPTLALAAPAFAGGLSPQATPMDDPPTLCIAQYWINFGLCVNLPPPPPCPSAVCG